MPNVSKETASEKIALDDRAQLPRWGYVIKGRVGFRFSDPVVMKNLEAARVVAAKPS